MGFARQISKYRMFTGTEMLTFAMHLKRVAHERVFVHRYMQILTKVLGWQI